MAACLAACQRAVLDPAGDVARQQRDIIYISTGLMLLIIVPVMILIAANRVGYKIDAIIFGFSIGAGFSVVENGFYLVRYSDLTIPVWVVRGLGTAVMHGTTTAVLAAVAHELGERKLRSQGTGLAFNILWFVPAAGPNLWLH